MRRTVRLWVLLSFFFAPPFAMANGMEGKTVSHDQMGKLKLGEKLPWFAAWTPNDGVFNRRKLVNVRPKSGHALVLFATWCTECKPGLNLLARKKAELEGLGINLILVDYQEESAKVKPFITAAKLDFATLLLDRFGRVATAFGAVQAKTGGQSVVSLPLTVVADKDGIVRGIYTKEGADYFEKITSALSPKGTDQTPVAEPAKIPQKSPKTATN